MFKVQFDYVNRMGIYTRFPFDIVLLQGHSPVSLFIHYDVILHCKNVKALEDTFLISPLRPEETVPLRPQPAVEEEASAEVLKERQ